MAWQDLQSDVAELFSDVRFDRREAKQGFMFFRRRDARTPEQKIAHAAEERARYARNLEQNRAYQREQKRKQYRANPEKQRARKRRPPTDLS